MDEKFKNKILADIYKNGYLQELEVSQILSNKGFYIKSNQFYSDPDTKQSREIDIIALNHVPPFKPNEVQFAINLIIEVKSSKARPWVFFCKKNSYLSLDHFGDDWLIKYNINTGRRSLFTGHPRYGIDYKAHNYYEAFKKSSETSNIYKSLWSCSKATHAFFKLEKELKKDIINDTTPHFDIKKPSIIVLYIPLVIFDGSLLRGYYDDDNEFILEETSYVTTDHSIFSDNEHGSQYPIDIVKMDSLNQYIDNLMMWAKTTVNVMSEERLKMS